MIQNTGQPTTSQQHTSGTPQSAVPPVRPRIYKAAQSTQSRRHIGERRQAQAQQQAQRRRKQSRSGNELVLLWLVLDVENGELL
ncbi:hypothetical protein PILCRDRAFT_759191 [Piloderma croceum F 1598]|uniref:Uncharacterized protein n=1 Tax=Piloderma croceum (strain F 1598) TaxID=765440 RepID=A0A0C3B1U0_PILCF|nr:hypothetical protein PILCRDRAFT_759191 [Piloderma croceum F 1598]